MLHAFGRPGVPLYVIFSGGRAEDPIVLPEVITADLVIDALDQSVGSSD
jgi:thiol:disulfide interchange protein